MFGTIPYIPKPKEKPYYASVEIRKEQFRRVFIEGNISYEELCLCMDRLYRASFITKSCANRYKSWYRRMERGEM
jgi:hypothetical protein